MSEENGNTPATKADLAALKTELLAAMQEMVDHIVTVRLGRFAESVGQEFSSTRDEFNRRFESVDRRMDRLGEGLGAVQQRLAGVEHQLSSINRWADRFDRDFTQLSATQVAQQRAVDDLARRLTGLEPPRRQA